MNVLEKQLAELRSHYPDVSTQDLPTGGILITFPGFQIPVPGWNKPATTIFFVAPVGFPLSPPDCFWADFDLYLAAGNRPQATQVMPLPINNQTALWFSWHVQSWNPNQDTLMTFVEVIKQRLRTAA